MAKEISKMNIGLEEYDLKDTTARSAASAAQSAVDALGGKVGQNNGIAQLDAQGKVPASQLPSYVDDVLEYSAKSAFPTSGEPGKIYVSTDDNKTYRWSGSAYVEISASIALGTTSSTAFAGDKGQTAYSHATDSARVTAAKASGLYKIAVTAEGHVAGVTAVEKSDITALGIPGTNTDTGATSVTVSGSGNAVTGASYDASSRKLTLTKGETFATQAAVNSLGKYAWLGKQVANNTDSEIAEALNASDYGTIILPDNPDQNTVNAAVTVALGHGTAYDIEYVTGTTPVLPAGLANAKVYCNMYQTGVEHRVCVKVRGENTVEVIVTNMIA